MEDYMKSYKQNPLLRPIHGVSLEVYAAALYYRASGIPMDRILGFFNINPTVWNEVDMLWTNRMEEDASLTVITFFSRYYNEAEEKQTLYNY